MSAPQITSMLTGLPLATLATIDIQKLRSNDSAEKQKLLAAAKEDGFFYLSLEALPELDEVEGVVSGINDLERDLFGLSDEEKMEFDVDKQGVMKLNGYKPVGRNRGGVEGKRDGFESWAIPKDGVIGLGETSFARPAVLDSQLHVVNKLIKYCQFFTNTIHKALSDTLELEGSERLESFHRNDQRSPCILRLLKYHAQPMLERGAVQTPHTDLGSLTVLFTSQPGLQVLKRGAASDAWEFVPPRPHCAIVNVGDVLSMLTGGQLQSSLHRVGPLPGHAMDTRYSFAYLQRPEGRTLLKVPGTFGKQEEITSGDWLRRKYSMLRKDTYAHGQQWIVTGRPQVDVIPV